MVVRVPGGMQESTTARYLEPDGYVEGEKGLVNGTEWNRWEQINKYQNLRNGLCNSRVNGSLIAAEATF